MTNTIESSENERSRLGSLSAAGKARFAAFTLVAAALLAVNALEMPRDLLVSPVTGWFQEMGIHQFHDMVLFATLWVGLFAAVALQLYRPTGRVNAVLAPLALFAPMALVAYLADSPLFTGFAISAVLALLALALHPAGRSLRRFDRVERVDRRTAGLLALGAIPLLAFAGLELSRQFGSGDDHAMLVHYGGMAVVAGFVVLMGVLAVLRERDWRFAAWSAGLVAAFTGVASAAFPAMESSLGTYGGALLALWAVAFVVSVEYARRDAAETERESVVERGTRPA